MNSNARMWLFTLAVLGIVALLMWDLADAATPTQLTWIAPTQNTDGTAIGAVPLTYSIYQGLRGQSPKPLLNSGVKGTAMPLPDLTKGGCFQLSTTSDGDEGPLSPEVCLGLPKPPTGLAFK